VDTPSFAGWNPPVIEEGTFDPKILQGLKDFGMKAVPEKPEAISRGYWVGIQIDSATGVTKGGVSREMEGAVVGY
jgi:hypothetical protein